ncbi:ribonuclease HI [Meiothermus rufus]|uniref:ribonuclease HI n=1 Tax=Meiothermus rufus TaxID=604332 RepID=UPI0004235293|nr:RNase H family protein [Meiothermus rufus]
MNPPFRFQITRPRPEGLRAWEKAMKAIAQERPTYLLFGDGSSLPGPWGQPRAGGWAVVVLRRQGEGYHSQQVLEGGEPRATVETMEFMAVLKGLEALPLGAKAAVFTDNETIHALLNPGQKGHIRIRARWQRENRHLLARMKVAMARRKVRVYLLPRGIRVKHHRKAHRRALAAAQAVRPGFLLRLWLGLRRLLGLTRKPKAP